MVVRKKTVARAPSPLPRVVQYSRVELSALRKLLLSRLFPRLPRPARCSPGSISFLSVFTPRHSYSPIHLLSLSHLLSNVQCRIEYRLLTISLPNRRMRR